MTMELTFGHYEQPEPTEPESLEEKRVFLHTELGRAAAELCAAQARYNQLIIRTIEINEQINHSDVDRWATISRVQGGLSPLMIDHADELTEDLGIAS